jgi:hypothetical protein
MAPPIIVQGLGGVPEFKDILPWGEKPDEPKPGEPGFYTARPTDAAALKALIARELAEDLERVFDMSDFEFPREWDNKVAQRVLDNAVETIIDRTSSHQARLFSTAQETTTRLEGEIEQNKGLRIPPADEAIKIRLAPSFENDLWNTETISSVDYAGPRRIWSVNFVNEPNNLVKGQRGPYRYRLSLDDVQFTPLSYRFLDRFSDATLQNSAQTGSRFEVTYGIVIKDMPWFGSELPRDFFRRTAFQNPPAQLNGNVPSTQGFMATAHKFAESKGNDTFVTNAPLLYTAFNKTSLEHAGNLSWIAPDDYRAYTSSIGGLGFMMINGTNADAVYSQINGRESANLTSIGGNAAGPSFSLPEGFEVLPPCVAGTCVRAAADGEQLDAIELTDLEDGTVAAQGRRRIQEGAPIRYTDCEALVLRPNAFAMVIQVVPPLILDWVKDGLAPIFTDPSNDMYGATWHTSGIKVDPQGDRETYIDIVVE